MDVTEVSGHFNHEAGVRGHKGGILPFQDVFWSLTSALFSS